MFEPLLSSPQPVPVHGVLALFSLFAGAVQFSLPKGTLLHRSLGYVWISAMAVVAVTSFFINEFRWVGPFGPIHVLSILVLWNLLESIRAARLGQIKKHKSNMIQLYAFGLLLAGAFTLAPGRVMHQVVFGG